MGYRKLTEEERIAAGLAEPSRYQTAGIDPEPETAGGLMRNQLVDVAKGVPSGLTKGLSYVAGLPGFLERALTYVPFVPGSVGFDYPGEEEFGSSTYDPRNQQRYLFPGPQQIQDFGRKYFAQGPMYDYKPGTLPGRVAQTGAEWATGGAIGKAPKVAATIAGTGGVVSQGAEEIGGGTGAQIGSGLGTVAALSTVNALLGRSNAPRMLQKRLGQLTEKEIAEAKRLQTASQEAGVPLSGPEALADVAPGIPTLASDVISTSQGGKIFGGFFKPRPEQTRIAVENSLNKIASENPSKLDLSKQISALAEKIILEAKKARTAASQRAGYTQAETELANPQSVEAVIANINRVLKTTKPGQPLFIDLTALKTSLIRTPAGKSKVLDASGKPVPTPAVPETNINILDVINKDLKHTVEAGQGSKFEVEKSVASHLRNIQKELDNVLLENPSFAQGRKEFKEISETVTDIILRNTEALQSKNIKASTLTNLIFDQKNMSAKDVKAIAGILNQADPTAFTQISRLWLKNALEKAMNPALGQMPGGSMTGGVKLAKDVFGTVGSEKRRIFMTMLDGVADANGVKDIAAYKVGFEKLMEVLSRQAKIPGVGSRTAPRGQLDVEAARTGAEALDVMSTRPTVSLTNWIKENIMGKTYTELAESMTAPDSVTRMIELSKMSPGKIQRLFPDPFRTSLVVTPQEIMEN
jgi:hypothetical protein